jgi:hypothetical protein
MEKSVEHITKLYTPFTYDTREYLGIVSPHLSKLSRSLLKIEVAHTSVANTRLKTSLKPGHTATTIPTA